jgi:hypothetical protein
LGKKSPPILKEMEFQARKRSLWTPIPKGRPVGGIFKKKVVEPFQRRMLEKK